MPASRKTNKRQGILQIDKRRVKGKKDYWYMNQRSIRKAGNSKDEGMKTLRLRACNMERLHDAEMEKAATNTASQLPEKKGRGEKQRSGEKKEPGKQD